MELLIHLISLAEYDLSYFDEENRATILSVLKSGSIPGEIKLTNSVPELDFYQEFTIAGHQELLTFPVRKLLEDLIVQDSSINRFMDLLDKNDKAVFFCEMWKNCLELVLQRFFSRLESMEQNDTYDVFYGNMHVDEIGVIGGEFRSTPTFKIKLPKNIIKKYYPHPQNFIPELEGTDYQQFFDIKKLSKEELFEYVLPYYYVTLGEPYNERIRDDKQLQDLLISSSIESFFAALA